MFIDPLYLIFALPALIVGIVAQILLKIWTGRYFKQTPVSNFNGAQTVEKISNNHNFDISLALTNQSLGDNYNPTNRVLTLSKDIAEKSSITSVGIAAHELGHVQQHMTGSALIRLRTALVPTLNIGTNIGYIMLIGGIILGLSNLAWLGIILFSGATFFSLITLPIEIDASRRALKLINQEQILLPQEIPGVKKVLSAAALTYVAATIQSIGTLLYFILRVQGIGRRD
ncbi:zinc metallopeptidase [Candidatus Dojkabacteria bacterium]|uniref:Zinc metallopeptidase n=1 Tax=Candidatus Dojkabacteria bacterium TaxID=2099670 RepID=A0A955I7L3_9BACT|nr:zinc metallopeptidase [Candidatus Dojkabacteria bacterium]